MAEMTLLVYGALAVIGFSILVGAVSGYWIRAGEERLRTRTPAYQSRHAAPKESPDE